VFFLEKANIGCSDAIAIGSIFVAYRERKVQAMANTNAVAFCRDV